MRFMRWFLASQNNNFKYFWVERNHRGLKISFLAFYVIFYSFYFFYEITPNSDVRPLIKDLFTFIFAVKLSVWTPFVICTIYPVSSLALQLFLWKSKIVDSIFQAVLLRLLWTNIMSLFRFEYVWVSEEAYALD